MIELEAFSLPKALLERMRAEVEVSAPEEGCGLLGGKGNEATEIYPVPNALHSPVRFRMDPGDQWESFQAIEAKGLDLVAIYHSHPHGPEVPSLTDIAEAYYPEVVYLIWSRLGDEWQCRGFRIRNGAVQEVALQFSD
jgi:proteasome lid subunit RPN8/RPN11